MWPSMLLISHNCNFRSDARVPILPNVFDISVLSLLKLLCCGGMLWWRRAGRSFVQTLARRAWQRSAARQVLRVCLARWRRLITVQVPPTSQWQHRHRRWRQRQTVPRARRRSPSPTLSLLLTTCRHLSLRFWTFSAFGSYYWCCLLRSPWIVLFLADI